VESSAGALWETTMGRTTKTAAPTTEATTETPAREGRPVIVTTEHKGVFFGYLPDGQDPDAAVVEIQHGRMAIFWSADVRGLPGLAAHGPTVGCRISPPVPGWRLKAVSSVLEVTPEAARAWELAPWAK
jgi:hypothetical protein